MVKPDAVMLTEAAYRSSVNPRRPSLIPFVFPVFEEVTDLASGQSESRGTNMPGYIEIVREENGRRIRVQYALQHPDIQDLTRLHATYRMAMSILEKRSSRSERPGLLGGDVNLEILPAENELRYAFYKLVALTDAKGVNYPGNAYYAAITPCIFGRSTVLRILDPASNQPLCDRPLLVTLNGIDAFDRDVFNEIERLFDSFITQSYARMTGPELETERTSIATARENLRQKHQCAMLQWIDRVRTGRFYVLDGGFVFCRGVKDSVELRDPAEYTVDELQRTSEFITNGSPLREIIRKRAADGTEYDDVKKHRISYTKDGCGWGEDIFLN